MDESVPGVAGRNIGGDTKREEETTGEEGRGRVPGVNL